MQYVRSIGTAGACLLNRLDLIFQDIKKASSRRKFLAISYRLLLQGRFRKTLLRDFNITNIKHISFTRIVI
ncbi:MAG: hypothetical protein A2176_07435 [Spirochaetes bacterium RBG_13_51_14]|nr:MAG: hypothetical protein A2176_07435 [Spirochaetes bacterium RBG_13_51_14]